MSDPKQFRVLQFVLFLLFITCVLQPYSIKAAGGSYGWTYGWTRTGGGAGEEFGGQGVDTDSEGNIFITGGYSYTIDFDGGAGTDEHTASNTYADIFITKYNSEGSYGWTRTFGGTGEDYGMDVATDSDGNVFITGYFQSSANFDDTGGDDTHSAVWGTDIFITKYNSDGSYGWTRTIGDTGNQLGYSIAVDQNDDVVVLGYFTGTVDFDATSGTDTHSSSSGTTFVTKYHNDGSYSWTRNFGNSAQQWEYGLTTDASGYIYATGFFSGTADFDGSDGVDNHTSGGSNDIFITRLSPDGTYKWTKTIGDNGDDKGIDVAVDATGYLYVTGYFSNTVNFNTDGGTDNHVASGGKDSFILKLKESGKFVWVKTFGGNTIYDWGSGIDTDTSGNFFISGTFGDTVDFDTGAGTDNYTAGPGIDSFITKYNADGTYSWTRPLTGTTVDDTAEAFAIAVHQGNAYLAGFFIGTVDFDGTTGTDNQSSDPGNFDFFLTSYTDDVPQISDLQGQDNSGTGEISWTTDADSSTQIEYGLTDDYGTSSSETDTSPRVKDHSQNIPSLHTCARYYYRVLSSDSDGNKAISDNRAFNASGCLASTVVGGTSELLATTGGSFDLTNGQSTVTLLVPSGAVDEDTAYQINLLDPDGVTVSPSGKSLAKGNFFNLLAVSQSDEVIDTFSDPVYFTVNYGPDTESSYQEGSLDIYKFDGSTWNRQNCTLDTSANTITCALGGFSVYGVFGQPQSSSGFSPASTPGCNNLPPSTVPDLFQINISDNQATLYFTPVGPDSQYFVSFSTQTAAEEHGALVRLGSHGVQQFTVNYLSGGTTYYFKVRGQNGCMPGPWSSIQQATTLTRSLGTIATFYKYGSVARRLISSPNSLTSIKY